MATQRVTCTSFHFWWNKKLLKHCKVSKYYKTDCLVNFLSLSIFLLPTKSVKNSHTEARFFFILLKSVLKQIWNSNNAMFQPQGEDWKGSFKVRQISGLFCHLTAMILGSLAIKVSGASCNEIIVPRKNDTNYLRLSVVFMWNCAERKRFNFYLWRIFF